MTIKKLPDVRRWTEPMQRAVYAALEKEVSDIATEIKVRTERGTSTSGASFERYSPSYNVYKSLYKGGIINTRGKNKGRIKQKYRKKVSFSASQPVQVLTPDLTLTGKMLRNLKYSIRRNIKVVEGKLYFIGGAKTAEKVRKNQKTRPFFGLSQEQKQRLNRVINEVMAKWAKNPTQ
jgi:hypothetical protein